MQPAAILAAALLALTAPTAPPGDEPAPSSSAPAGETRSDAPSHPKETLKKPVTVKCKLRDGSQLRGKVTAFDGEAIMGEGLIEPADQGSKGTPRAKPKPLPFDRVAWIDIAQDDLAEIADKILDEKQADDLLLKAELLLSAGNTSAGAKALARAVKLDPALKPKADEIRARGEELAARAEHAEYLAKFKRMSDAIPNTGAPAWPALSLEDSRKAIAEMKSRAETICKDVGMRPSVVETRYFILYGAVNEAAMRECSRSLDAMYEKVLELFGIPAGLNLFWGKAVVFLTPTEDTFRAVEAAGFKSMTPRGVVGLCHQIGPMVFVNMFWSDNQDTFDSTLIHETVHGIMHRYYSAQRLPAWADEGLSEYIASISFKSSPVEKGRMPQALEYIRAGRSVADVMRLNYGDGSWPGPNAIGYAVGYASIKLMIRQQPDAFGRWIRAVKGGKPWEQALRDDFGHPVEKFAPTVEQWYRTKN